MARVDWRERVVINPEIHHGEPCIRGTRIPVKVIVSSVAEGMSFEDILREYPPLSAEDLWAALAYSQRRI